MTSEGRANTRLLSVVICTHNPRADYFGRCIGALSEQTLPIAQWELVVIDNLSDDPIAGRVDLSWHPNAKLVREDKLGLTPARLRGIREAAGDLMVFVDDDNVLGPEYLATARLTSVERPFLGAWSGQCWPVFESTPAPWTERYWGALCIRRFEQEVWSNLPRLAETMPAGAGLCVRREAALHYVHLHDVGERRFQFDRTGSSLVSGGDNDLAACACDIGLGVGLMPKLQLEHLIPPQRLTADYIARLVEGIEFSSVLLDASRGLAAPARSRLGRAADLARIARLRPPHNRILAAAHRGRRRAAHILAGHYRSAEHG